MAPELHQWRWKLDQIQEAMQKVAGGIEVCFSFKPGSSIVIDDIGDADEFVAGDDEDDAASTFFPYGRVLEAHSCTVPMRKENDGILVNLGENQLPFFAFWEPLSPPSLRDSWSGGGVADSAVWSEWHYYREDVQKPPEEQRAVLKNMRDRMAQLRDVYDAAREACHESPQAILEAVGDLSVLGGWPTVLHYVALKRIHPLLRADWFRIRYPPSEEVLLYSPSGPQAVVNREFCNQYSYVVGLIPGDVATATGSVFDAFRNIAETEENRQHASVPTNIESVKPRWNADRRELMFGDQLCKKFRQKARNQICVLEAFQMDGWPERIDDPLPPKRDTDHRQRLADTIRGLKNKAICFELDGNEGILWTPADKGKKVR
jgi:hypothetical protein